MIFISFPFHYRTRNPRQQVPIPPPPPSASQSVTRRSNFGGMIESESEEEMSSYYLHRRPLPEATMEVDLPKLENDDEEDRRKGRGMIEIFL